jgi:transposase
MSLIHLNHVERRKLAAIARRTKDARVLRRAQVLLELDRGEAPTTLAERFQVSRSTIYNWVERYRTSGPCDTTFKDRPRSGRPRKGQGHPDPG